jgi:hypothetical protein
MQDTYETARRRMLAEIARDVAETSRYLGKNHLDPAVIAALEAVPRHEFVPENLRDRAYENRPQPIGRGQTISQPFIVAIMTDLAGLDPESCRIHRTDRVTGRRGEGAAEAARLRECNRNPWRRRTGLGRRSTL